MHGPDEVASTIRLFERAEVAFRMPALTLKIGIMDEERRTTVNLKRCIEEARDRIVFINTGFLDRTGDEIHTSMRAGPVLPKSGIAVAPWRVAYEAWNVDVGLEMGMDGKGQIGKGMWAEPDNMRGLLASKGAHPRAGATCAWVPSPTGATIHAMHYHTNNVATALAKIKATRRRTETHLRQILVPPLTNDLQSMGDAVRRELDECAQLILGYVVRWVEHGVGCSKVPDLNNVGKMEDRATLRISSQLLSNWVLHGVLTETQVRDAFARWAAVVDEQNKDDGRYRPMCVDLGQSIAFQAGLELVLRGTELPNGYTESVLHGARRREKAQLVKGA
jgi:malate synthase